jgi:hypothetical protein
LHGLYGPILIILVRTCQKQQDDKTRCSFFLWDTDAQSREAQALASNSRTEPAHSGPSNPAPTTPSRRPVSPPPPYTLERDNSGPSRKRTFSATNNVADDEYGLDETFDQELNEVMTQIETPSKAAKTSDFATPATTRRKLPWQMDQASTTNAHGLQTPQTANRTTDIFASRNTDREHPQTATPSSSTDTPTPSRFKNVIDDDLARDVFGLLGEAQVRLPAEKDNELKGLLSRHMKSAEGYKRGRDVIRATVKAKDAKITELTYRISTLEAELEAEKAMVKHLRWETQADLDET